VGSPVTFSGFNQIDFNAILNLAIQQEREPIDRLDTQKKALETQKTAFGTLAGKLSTLQSAVDTLKDADSLSTLSATSSDTGVGVATTSGTVAGSYAIVVSQLAKTQVTASTSTYGALTDVVATGGTLTLTPASGSPVTVTLTGSTTIQELATAINDATDSPATATVVQSSPGVYQLVLTGAETGADNAFTITNALTGGSGLTFTDTDSDGVSGDSAADNTQAAVNASFTVNNLTVASASNTVTDVIPGVTLTLKTADPSTTVNVEVARDADAVKTTINKFISAYNDVLSFAKDQDTAAVAGKASIGRDPLLRGLKQAMREALQDSYAEGGTITRLAGVGIGFDVNGKMTLDADAFDTAFDAAPPDVQGLFSGPAGDTGAFGAVATLLDSYTQSGGLIADVRDRITDQVKSMSNRLDDMEARLEVRRAMLAKEYQAADAAMTQLHSQGSSLDALANQYRLF